MSKSMMNQVILVKTQADDTTEATIAASDAMLVRDITINPASTEFADRNLIKPYFGNSGQVKVQGFSTIEVTVELAGSGAAGTAPKFDPLLTASGFAKTITAGVSVAYSPLTTAQKACTIHHYLDGVKHVFVGCKGNVVFTLDKGIPVARFSFVGFEGVVTDATPPSGIDYSAFVQPLAINKANTPTYALHGETVKASALSIDMGNEVNYRNYIGTESVAFTNRNATGNTTFEYEAMATANWWSIQSAGTLAALEFVHGTVAGNIIEIDAPKVQVSNAALNNDQNVAMLSCNLSFQPNAGNDEVVLTFK